MEKVINLKKIYSEKKSPKPKNTKKTKNKTDIKFQWRALEYEYYIKNKSWFIFWGIFALILSILAIFQKNYLFLLVVGLGYFCVIMYTIRKPNLCNFAITTNGVRIDNILYNFSNLKSFYISNDGKEIRFQGKKIFMPEIKIPLKNQDPDKIRKFLIKYLPEKEQEESITENLAKFFKF